MFSPGRAYLPPTILGWEPKTENQNWCIWKNYRLIELSIKKLNIMIFSMMKFIITKKIKLIGLSF